MTTLNDKQKKAVEGVIWQLSNIAHNLAAIGVPPDINVTTDFIRLQHTLRRIYLEKTDD